MPNPLPLNVQSELQALGLYAVDNENVSVATAVANLDTAKIDLADFVFIVVHGGDIRWTRTGTDPTATFGNKAFNRSVIELSPAEAVLFRAISESTSVTVTLAVEYCRITRA